MARDALTEAFDHFKRLDHLLYVSLKYAKSEEVFTNLIERFVSSYETGFDSLLKLLKKQKKISELPLQPLKKAIMVREFYGEQDAVTQGLSDYFKLKKLVKDGFFMKNHYRKHVTIICNSDEDIAYEIPDFYALHQTLRSVLLFTKSLLVEI